MYLVEFTYDTYCQGTRDENRGSMLVPDAHSFEEAVAAIKHGYIGNPRNFHNQTVFVAFVPPAIDVDKTENELAMQREFIEWLKKQELYNEYASAKEMASMFDVYKRLAYCQDCGYRVDTPICGRCEVESTPF